MSCATIARYTAVREHFMMRDDRSTRCNGSPRSLFAITRFMPPPPRCPPLCFPSPILVFLSVCYNVFLSCLQIWLKREELAHTGAHKINNAVGQALLAKRIGKNRIIAETGAGQHGVATATVCALLGMECVIYMGAVDCERQKLNVFRMKMLGAKVRCTEETGEEEPVVFWVVLSSVVHVGCGCVATVWKAWGNDRRVLRGRDVLCVVRMRLGDSSIVAVFFGEACLFSVCVCPWDCHFFVFTPRPLRVQGVRFCVGYRYCIVWYSFRSLFSVAGQQIRTTACHSL